MYTKQKPHLNILYLPCIIIHHCLLNSYKIHLLCNTHTHTHHIILHYTFSDMFWLWFSLYPEGKIKGITHGVYRCGKTPCSNFMRWWGGPKQKFIVKELYVRDASFLWPVKLALIRLENKQNHWSFLTKVVFHTSLKQMFNIWPLTLIRSQQWHSRDWHVHSKILGCDLMVTAASVIRTIRSSSESTVDNVNKALMWPHRKKSIHVRSGDLGGQTMGPPHPIQQS